MLRAVKLLALLCHPTSNSQIFQRSAVVEQIRGNGFELVSIQSPANRHTSKKRLSVHPSRGEQKSCLSNGQMGEHRAHSKEAHVERGEAVVLEVPANGRRRLGCANHP